MIVRIFFHVTYVGVYIPFGSLANDIGFHFGDDTKFLLKINLISKYSINSMCSIPEYSQIQYTLMTQV